MKIIQRKHLEENTLARLNRPLLMIELEKKPKSFKKTFLDPDYLNTEDLQRWLWSEYDIRRELDLFDREKINITNDIIFINLQINYDELYRYVKQNLISRRILQKSKHSYLEKFIKDGPGLVFVDTYWEYEPKFKGLDNEISKKKNIRRKHTINT